MNTALLMPLASFQLSTVFPERLSASSISRAKQEPLVKIFGSLPRVNFGRILGVKAR